MTHCVMPEYDIWLLSSLVPEGCDWGDSPSKTYEVTLFTLISYKSEKNI